MEKVLRILMIEDSPDDVLLSLHAIKKGGYKVFFERVDREETLIAALNNSWDLILCDYSMPYLSGLKALELVRERNEEIPFIILSGTIGEEKAIHAIKRGANDYVNKQHSMLLLPAIERVFQEQRIKKENYATKLALEETKERLYYAFHYSGTGIALIDLNRDFMETNPAFGTLIGYSYKDLQHIKIDQLIDEDFQASFNAALSDVVNNKKSNEQVELRMIHKNAQKLWIVLNISLIKHSSASKKPYLILHFQDRTEQRYFEERLLFLTTYSNLTGLLNRASIFAKMNELIHQKVNQTFTVYCLDIDRFKRVNETYGAHLGDNFLKKISTQLKESIAANEILGYLGGNSFIIIDTRPASTTEARIRGEYFADTLQEPILMNNKELTLTASVGACQYPKDGRTINQLLKAATASVQESKRKGGDCYTLYNPELALQSNNLIIDSDLRKALATNDLLVFYQPQVSAHTNKPSGMEALVRWNKNGALILPYEFIPIAEESSLIIKIGEQILTQACTFFANLHNHQRHFLPERISVNLSARQFASPKLIPMLENIFKTVSLAPHQLELEITETALIENIDKVRNTLHEIGKIGVQIAIDDFGTGYSSLGYLKDLPINRLKIDKTFIDACLVDYNSQSIIASIISLAHRIGLEVTAEGVENKEQLQFLKKHHCDEYQGFYFSPPIAQEELGNFFSQYH